MYNFTDRIPTQPNKRLITHADGTSETVTITMADAPSVAGTPITRAAMMAIQGMEDCTTVFNADGSITETFAHGTVKTTTFNSDGSITESVKYTSTGQQYTQTTVFNSDGSITVSGGDA